MKLPGRTVLITGAASGVGRAMALNIAARGGRIVAWDIDEARFEGADGGTAWRRARLGGRRRRRARQGLRRRREHRARSTSSSTTPASSAGGGSSRCPDEQIEKTMGVNTLALFWTTRAFLPGMIERRSRARRDRRVGRGPDGRVGARGLHCQQVRGRRVRRRAAVGARRIAPGVKTTIVCPYYINTGMFDGVRTRFPLLLPILDEAKVSARIVRAIEKGPAAPGDAAARALRAAAADAARGRVRRAGVVPGIESRDGSFPRPPPRPPATAPDERMRRDSRTVRAAGGAPLDDGEDHRCRAGGAAAAPARARSSSGARKSARPSRRISASTRSKRS